jgi:hypothetical protein
MFDNNKNTISKDLNNLGLVDEVLIKRIVKYIQLRNSVFLLIGSIVGVVLFIGFLSLVF